MFMYITIAWDIIPCPLTTPQWENETLLNIPYQSCRISRSTKSTYHSVGNVCKLHKLHSPKPNYHFNTQEKIDRLKRKLDDYVRPTELENAGWVSTEDPISGQQPLGNRDALFGSFRHHHSRPINIISNDAAGC
jgi:hypothetical protein